MTDRELLKKLNNLKNLQPAEAWKKSNREILLSQVENTSLDYEPAFMENFFMVVKNVFSTIYQPVLVTMSLVLFLLFGLVFSHRILNFKPTDSLYIAKMISERAMLNTVFNKDAKTKMELEFATNHVQDIASTLADPQFNTEANQAEVAKLNDSFKTELAKVKSLSATQVVADDTVHSADSGKDANGVSVYDPNANTKTTDNTSNDVPSSTATVCTTSATSSDTVLTKDPQKIIDEAEKLFNDKDYSGAADKLKEINNILQ